MQDSQTKDTPWCVCVVNVCVCCIRVSLRACVVPWGLATFEAVAIVRFETVSASRHRYSQRGESNYGYTRSLPWFKL